jgi:hypothetical protein
LSTFGGIHCFRDNGGRAGAGLCGEICQGLLTGRQGLADLRDRVWVSGPKRIDGSRGLTRSPTNDFSSRCDTRPRSLITFCHDSS